MKSLKFNRSTIFHIAAVILFSFGIMMTGCGSSSSKSSSPAGTYGISGTVTGDIEEGVTIALTGTASATTTTGSDGKYSFSALAAGTYAVTASYSAGGYAFSDAQTVTITNADITGIDFTSTAVPTYSISGAVIGDIEEGVTISVTGTASASTTTLADGSYTITSLVAGSYTVTASYSAGGYVFSAAQTVTLSAADVTGISFTSAVLKISGTISGDIAAGVTVTLSYSGDHGPASLTATTAADGTYSFTSGISAGTAYTITPSLYGYTFADTSTSSTSVSVTLTTSVTVDFISTQLPSFTVSGTVTGDVASGVPIVLSGNSTATGTAVNTIATTASDGTYSFTAVYAGTYSVTAVLYGYSFTTVSGITVDAANISGEDFVSTALTTKYTVSGLVADSSAAAVIDGTVTVKDLSGATVATTSTDITTGAYSVDLYNGSYTISIISSTITTQTFTASVTVAGAAVTQDITGVSTTTHMIFNHVNVDGTDVTATIAFYTDSALTHLYSTVVSDASNSGHGVATVPAAIYYVKIQDVTVSSTVYPASNFTWTITNNADSTDTNATANGYATANASSGDVMDILFSGVTK